MDHSKERKARTEAAAKLLDVHWKVDALPRREIEEALSDIETVGASAVLVATSVFGPIEQDMQVAPVRSRSASTQVLSSGV